MKWKQCSKTKVVCEDDLKPVVVKIVKYECNHKCEKGEKGDKGDRGMRGDDGLPGENGKDGKDGKDGATIIMEG